MIAFLVEIDGERTVLAGVEDWSILALHINAMRAEAKPDEGDDLHFSVGGLTLPDSGQQHYHFRWPRKDLKVGSVVKVTIVESESVDPPIKRYRSDAQVQENPFTEEEIREMRYKDYLSLKAEFEPNSDG